MRLHRLRRRGFERALDWQLVDSLLALGSSVHTRLKIIDHARIGGALCVLVSVVGIVSLVAGTSGARLSEIQLGTDPQHVLQLVRIDTVRTAANRAITIDYFFLTAYWAAFVALASLLVRRGGLWRVVAVLAAGMATVTATLDVIENVRTSDVLALYQPGSQLGQKQLDALRHISLLKWGTAAATVALIAGVFAQRDRVSVIALTMLLVAGIGFAGINRHGLIHVYLAGVGLLTIIIGILLLTAPSAMMRRL